MSPYQRLLSAITHWWERFSWGLSEAVSSLQVNGYCPVRTMHLADLSGEGWVAEGVRLVRNEVGASKKRMVLHGLLVPEDDVLWGHFDLEGLALSAIPSAVNEAVWRDCPVPVDEVRVAWRVEPNSWRGWHVDWCACLQRRLDEAAQAAQLPVSGTCPAYVIKSGKIFAMLGDQSAPRRQVFRAIGFAGASILAVLAIAVPLLTPLALKREDAVRATAFAEATGRDAALVQKKLDELRQSAQLLEALGKAGSGAIPLATALNAVSEALPDDTWLDKIEIGGTDLKLYGLSPNTADLLAKMAKVPQFSEVRAAGASVRDAMTGKERFTLEVKWRGSVGGGA